MQLEYLEYLTKITPGVTIDALAESLHITRSGLSKALTVLEKEFNCQLIIRTRKGMYLTSEAEEIVTYTKAYFEKINIYRRTHPELSGKLILPTVAYSTRFFGTETISCFIKENPKVTVELQSAAPLHTHTFLEDQDREIALSVLLHHNGHFYPPCEYNILDTRKGEITYTGSRPEYTFVPCTFSRVCLECHKDLALQLKNFCLADLGKKKILLNTDPATFADSPIDYFLNTYCQLNYSIESDRNLYYKMLQNKLGYGFSNYSESLILPDNLVQILPKDEITVIYGYLEKNTEHSPAVQRFIEILKEKH